VSQVAFIDTRVDGHIRAEGWLLNNAADVLMCSLPSTAA